MRKTPFSTCFTHSKHQRQQAFPHQDWLVHSWTISGWVCSTNCTTCSLLHNVGTCVNLCVRAHVCVSSSAEALEGIDLGETTHKKPGTTVPESIHSFSESPARSVIVCWTLFIFFCASFTTTIRSSLTVINDWFNCCAIVRQHFMSTLVWAVKRLCVCVERDRERGLVFFPSCKQLLIPACVFSSRRRLGTTWGTQQESHSDYQQSEGQAHRWVLQKPTYCSTEAAVFIYFSPQASAGLHISFCIVKIPRVKCILGCKVSWISIL